MFSKFKSILLALYFLAIVIFPISVSAQNYPQTETYEGIITVVKEEKNPNSMEKYLQQSVEAMIVKGDKKGQNITIENGTIPLINARKFKTGDKVLINANKDFGRDHIASVVNTLILVYTGAAMPLLLLFTDNPRPFEEIINYEIIAEEIVRTMVASLGLILAVPNTTLLTAYFISKETSFHN